MNRPQRWIIAVFAPLALSVVMFLVDTREVEMPDVTNVFNADGAGNDIGELMRQVSPKVTGVYLAEEPVAWLAFILVVGAFEWVWWRDRAA